MKVISCLMGLFFENHISKFNEGLYNYFKKKDKNATLTFITPFYKNIPSSNLTNLKLIHKTSINICSQSIKCEFYKTEYQGFEVILVKDDFYLSREYNKEYIDDEIKDAFFCLSVKEYLSYLKKHDFVYDFCFLNDCQTSMISLLLSIYNFTTKCIQNVFNFNLGYANENAITEYFNLNKSYYTCGLTRFNDKVSYLKTGILTSFKTVFFDQYNFDRLLNESEYMDYFGSVLQIKNKDCLCFDDKIALYPTHLNFDNSYQAKLDSQSRIKKYINADFDFSKKKIFTYVCETSYLVDYLKSNINAFYLTNSILFIFTNKKEECKNCFEEVKKYYKDNVFIIDSYEINLRLDLLLSSDFTFIDYLNTPLIKDSIYCRSIPLYFNKYESKVKTLGIVNSFSFSNFLDFSKLLVDCFQIQKDINILNTCCHKNADDYKQEIFSDYFELLDEEMKGKVSKK